MHSVPRSTEPKLLATLRGQYTGWDGLNGKNRSDVRHELETEFNGLCAYCECHCKKPLGSNDSQEESNEHFRPRSLFPSLWLDWANLLYSCRKCNNSKNNKWPQYGYVNPSETSSQRPAHEFFSFDTITGEILPSQHLSPAELDMAVQTINDVDLNDCGIGLNDPKHLWNQRLRQVRRISERIAETPGTEDKVNILLEFVKPDKPFCSFVRSYFGGQFPLLHEICGEF